MSNRFDENSETLSKYLSLMTEIKKREEVIIGLYDGTCNAKYKVVNYEVMFFQLRKILEIIAKSPLLINEKEYRKVSKNPEYDWRIRKIMSTLEEINPDFYPQPISVLKRTSSPDEFISVSSGYLTKDDLCDAYDHCNNFLHAKNPLKEDREIKVDVEWNYIVSTIKKIHNLLNTHLCKPSVTGSFYYIGMEDGKGAVFGNIFSQEK